MSEAAGVALEFARTRNPGVGEAPLLPAVRDPSGPMGAREPRNIWRKAEARAGLERRHGRGWHSLRRKFATEIMYEPLSIVCRLGGWKDPETVLKCYQRPDEDDLRDALKRRQGVEKGGPTDTTNGHKGRLRRMK